MAIPDPALGIAATFDADRFRSAIRFAMQMGAPPDTALQAVFVFPTTGRTYFQGDATVPLDPATVRLDRDRKPLDPNIRAVDAPPRKVKVDCAVEIVRADANEIPVGKFLPTKAVVTVLDEEYEQIKGCRELIYNADRYLFGYEPDALGLFDVGTFTLIFYALDEN